MVPVIRFYDWPIYEGGSSEEKLRWTVDTLADLEKERYAGTL